MTKLTSSKKNMTLIPPPAPSPASLFFFIPPHKPIFFLPKTLDFFVLIGSFYVLSVIFFFGQIGFFFSYVCYFLYLSVILSFFFSVGNNVVAKRGTDGSSTASRGTKSGWQVLSFLSLASSLFSLRSSLFSLLSSLFSLLSSLSSLFSLLSRLFCAYGICIGVGVCTSLLACLLSQQASDRDGCLFW